ncbi:hypothetical protein FOE78_22195 [Microlunatus elymi]|uniref:Histidine phosphatase superfamily (Branch 1) n=1 Tax=Microlunatus elymi TaxID=2596828 RepID=A0A516Q4C3_9ACTN|nr:hypothetical protein [Microlunatus elymi]QDP98254.1 hypothetical protein FOE78_22195 [Microlunatus elymi]
MLWPSSPAGRLDHRHAIWESPDDAADRFQSGVDDLAGETMIIAAHGLFMVAWLSKIGYVDSGAAAGELWTSLQFPHLLTLRI